MPLIFEDLKRTTPRPLFGAHVPGGGIDDAEGDIGATPELRCQDRNRPQAGRRRSGRRGANATAAHRRFSTFRTSARSRRRWIAK